MDIREAVTVFGHFKKQFDALNIIEEAFKDVRFLEQVTSEAKTEAAEAKAMTATAVAKRDAAEKEYKSAKKQVDDKRAEAVKIEQDAQARAKSIEDKAIAAAAQIHANSKESAHKESVRINEQKQAIAKQVEELAATKMKLEVEVAEVQAVLNQLKQRVFG